MNNANLSKSPRLYINSPLRTGEEVELSHDQAHYLRSVMRREKNDALRLFNGQDGEFAAHLSTLDKKSAYALIEQQIVVQTPTPRRKALYFAPIKKNAMDFMIEKAVELGVTDLYPILTQRTEIRKIKAERITAQIIQASEQCERLDIPCLHDLQPLDKAMNSENTPVFWACERADAPPLSEQITSNGSAFLIGPEGGFTDTEKQSLTQIDRIVPVSLGPRILRAETAALYCLSQGVSS